MPAGLTKLISKLSGEGSYRKALELFQELPGMGIQYDCTIANAAISACAKGEKFHCRDVNVWRAKLSGSRLSLSLITLGPPLQGTFDDPS